MNRHGYHNEHEYDEEDAEEGNVEMPLPTYEEVVGASNTQIGFKEELLVPGMSHQGSRAGSSLHELPIRQPVRAPNDEVLRRPESPRKKCPKSFIVGLTGVVLIPLLILLIVLQLKSCNTCEHAVETGNTNGNTKDTNIRFTLEELEHCNSHLERAERRYSDAFSELQSVKKQRDELLINQENTDTELKKLRYQYNTAFSDATNMLAEVEQLKKDVEKYKALLAKAQNSQNNQKDS